MLACPKAEVILVLLDKREIFRAALLKRLRGVAEPYPWPTSARSAWVIAACRGSSLLLSRNRMLLSSKEALPPGVLAQREMENGRAPLV